MISNNQILIGLSIVAISCIYLFYLNFTKSQESNFEKSMIKKINLDNSNLEKKVSKLEDVVTYNNKTIKELMDLVNNNSNKSSTQDFQSNENYLSEVQMKELAENTPNFGVQTVANESTEEATKEALQTLPQEEPLLNNLDIELDGELVNCEEGVENEEGEENEEGKEGDEEGKEEEEGEEGEEDEEEDEEGEEDKEELVNDTLKNEIFNDTDSINDLTLDDIENIQNLDSELVNELETELELDDDDFKLEDVNLKNDLNKEEHNNEEENIDDNDEMDLQLSTVKELKVLAKNYGLSNRGNKEELIKRITNHLVQKN